MASAHDAVRYRRAPHLIGYWRQADFIVRDCVSQTEVSTAPALLELLHFLDDWQSFDAVRRRFSDVSAESLERALRVLVDTRHIERLSRRSSRHTTRTKAEAAAAMDSPEWTPEPAAFHFSTRDVPFVKIDGPQEQASRPAAALRPPPPVKRYPGQRAIPLPASTLEGDLPRVLRARRTWRRFGGQPVAKSDVATLLELTWGVQHWVDVPGRPRMALKTSPSGGARHSIEAYVLALNIDGVPRGFYHYSPDRHALVRLKRGVTPNTVAEYLPVQEGYPHAAALFVMTSVFARVTARYPYPRAYRSIFAEAGHLCQTFCLVATALGLAPFCSMAFADSKIERDLNIDGVSEAAIYVAGVGARPDRTDWAPWTDASWPLPRRRSPRQRAR
jgi:SagB-type dehydrogenase family enzyme